MKCKSSAPSGVVLIFALTASVHSQLLLPSGGPYHTPTFEPADPSNWEYSKWDCLYSPSDSNGTIPGNRNYPDVAAPNGYEAIEYPGGDVELIDGTYQFVGQGLGSYIWDYQSLPDAQTAGFNLPAPNNSNPSTPFAIFHPDNPTLRQAKPSAFVVGAGDTGNIYSITEKTEWTLDDAVGHDLGSVVVQFQTQGRDIDFSTLKLRYNLDTTPIEIPATDLIVERESSAAAIGFTFTTRQAAEWDLSGLGIRKSQVVWKSSDTSNSLQSATLDTTDTYQRDKGIPAKRFFTGANNSDWSTPTNWVDAAGGNSLPEPYANVIFQGGSTLNIGSEPRKISLLEANTIGNFTVSGTSTLELGTGIKAAASASPRTITLGVPVHMIAFNSFDIGNNVTAVLNYPFSGNSGFEKRGTGSVLLNGNNTFSGSLYLAEGDLTLAGTNTYGNPYSYSLEQTYIYLGKLTLAPTGQLGTAGVKAVIGSTHHEIPGETRPSHLLIQGQRTFSNPIEFTGGLNPKLLTFTETGTGTTCSSTITFRNEIGGFGSDAGAPTGDVQLATPLASDSVSYTGSMSFGATLTGQTPYAIRKTGPGTITFSGNHKNYAHQTIVEGGNLVLASGTNLTGGNSITVNPGTNFTANGNISLSGAALLTVNGSLTGNGTLTRSGTPTITGSGSISKSLTIDNGTNLSPGNIIGALNFTGNQTWGAGGKLSIDLAAASPAANDLAAIAGSLAITSTSASPFVIQLYSRKADSSTGLVHDFNTAGSYAWTIATTTSGITGFAANKFSINTSTFANGTAGTFSVEVQGNNLVLRYTGNPIFPTFATWATSLPAGLRDTTADADHDGIVNLVEFVTGTSGSSANSGPLLTLGQQNESGTIYPTVAFYRADPPRLGVTLFLKSSTTLQNGSWQTIATKAGAAPWQGSAIVTEGTPSAGRTPCTLRDSVSISSSPRRFYRIETRNDQ